MFFKVLIKSRLISILLSLLFIIPSIKIMNNKEKVTRPSTSAHVSWIAADKYFLILFICVHKKLSWTQFNSLKIKIYSSLFFDVFKILIVACSYIFAYSSVSSVSHTSSQNSPLYLFVLHINSLTMWRCYTILYLYGNSTCSTGWYNSKFLVSTFQKNLFTWENQSIVFWTHYVAFFVY